MPNNSTKTNEHYKKVLIVNLTKSSIIGIVKTMHNFNIHDKNSTAHTTTQMNHSMVAEQYNKRSTWIDNAPSNPIHSTIIPTNDNTLQTELRKVMNRHNDKNLPRTSNINITLRGKNESNDPTKTESKITSIAKQSIDNIKRDLSYLTQPQVFTVAVAPEIILSTSILGSISLTKDKLKDPTKTEIKIKSIAKQSIDNTNIELSSITQLNFFTVAVTPELFLLTYVLENISSTNDKSNDPTKTERKITLLARQTRDNTNIELSQPKVIPVTVVSKNFFRYLFLEVFHPP